MEVKNIVLSGYYGCRNMGDDAFCLISVWGLKKYFNISNVSLLSNSGPINSDIDIKYLLPERKKFRGEFFFRSCLAVINTNMNIMAGGSILSHKSRFASLRNQIFLSAKLRINKLGAIGVSLGPFASDEDFTYIEHKLRSYSFLILRDKKSYEIACTMNLPYPPVLAADLAFLLPKIKQIDITREHGEYKLLGVSLCHYETYINSDIENERRREEILFDTLKIITQNTNIVIRFFIINDHPLRGDREITHKMINKLGLKNKKYQLIEYSSDTLSMWEKIAECDAVLSTRLHGAIFSAAANIPSILVEYHEKCTSYLDDIGVDDKWRIGDANISAEQINNKITDLLFHKTKDFYPNLTKLQKMAEYNFTKIVL